MVYDCIHVVHELYQARMTPDVMAQAVLAIDSLYDSEPLDGIVDSASFADVGMGGGRAKRDEPARLQLATEAGNVMAFESRQG
jgi:hypothetical protein